MKIFYGNDDYRQFSNPSQYAFLNWRLDNGYGENSNPYQYIFDNYTLRTAFIGNALLLLNNIIESGNSCNVADKLIFPILFNAWHGSYPKYLKAFESSEKKFNMYTTKEMPARDIITRAIMS